MRQLLASAKKLIPKSGELRRMTCCYPLRVSRDVYLKEALGNGQSSG